MKKILYTSRTCVDNELKCNNNENDGELLDDSFYEDVECDDDAELYELFEEEIDS